MGMKNFSDRSEGRELGTSSVAEARSESARNSELMLSSRNQPDKVKPRGRPMGPSPEEKNHEFCVGGYYAELQGGGGRIRGQRDQSFPVG